MGHAGVGSCSRCCAAVIWSLALSAAGSSEEAVKWTFTAKSGDLYPFAGIHVTDAALRFKQKLGGVISKNFYVYRDRLYLARRLTGNS